MDIERTEYVKGKTYRFTVLTPCLFRMEYSERGIFCDQKTQMIANREFEAAPYTVSEKNGRLTIETEKARLIYTGGAFDGSSLRVELKNQLTAFTSVWHYGETGHNLKGTTRTLDGADGAVPLEDGLFSREGWAVISDKGSILLTEDGWIETRPDPEAEDLYFFGYGTDYSGCLKDYYKLTGAIPVLPKFALGNWWSRYYKYTETSYLELMDHFENDEIPFTVGVIDMDWHLTDIDPKYGTGWTGYTWNSEYFPDPKRFTDELHRRGMKVTLNDHPADGVRAYEKLYPPFASYMGVDQEAGEPVLMDVTNRHLMDGYFRYVYEPLEADGVDFWWIDWQQGTKTAIAGLDPLWMLNHCHYLHSQKKDGEGLIFSRYAGPGSHRYPVGFSGDTVITWESLDFQPYFTATASNIGYAWWSHDIGGHMGGYKNDELALRWFQFGVFSPIMRLHSSCSEFNGKEPWRYRREAELIMDRFLRLRHQMIPYLHTMNRRVSEEGIPLIRPMYYENPRRQEAYQVSNEYYFGENLIVNPITQPMRTGINMGKVRAWLPEGAWIDLFTGMVYQGDRMIDLYRALDSIPVLGKAGSILTLDARTTGNAIDNPAALRVVVFAGADGSFRLDEETEGETWCSTHFSYQWGDDAVFTIHPEHTRQNGMPAQRSYELVFVGTASGMTAQLETADGTRTELAVHYDREKQRSSVVIPVQEIDAAVTVVTHKTALADNRISERIFELLNRAEISFAEKERIYSIIQKYENRSGAFLLDQLTLLGLNEDLFGAVKEILTSLE